MDFTKHSDEQLEAFWLDLGDQERALRETRRAVARERERRARHAELEKQAANLSDADVAALAQIVHARGIASEEAFGTIGGR